MCLSCVFGRVHWVCPGSDVLMCAVGSLLVRRLLCITRWACCNMQGCSCCQVPLMCAWGLSKCCAEAGVDHSLQTRLVCAGECVQQWAVGCLP